MKKISLLVLIVSLIAAFALVSCSNNAREPKTYTVTFDSKGGSDVPSQKVEEGKKVTEPTNPAKDGYDFVGWVGSDGSFFNFDKDALSSDITLYAVWDEYNGVFIVTFDTDGGSSVEPQKVEEGKYVSIPATPTKEGYDFRGWTVGDESYSFDQNAVSSDITLKANWSDATKYYTVYFDSCGGTEVAPQKVAEGSKVTKPGNPVYEGCNFDAWINEDYEPFDFENTTVTGDITLYADWSLKVYRVTFDTKGGSEVRSQVIIEGEKAEKPEDPVREGYDFKGWMESDNSLFNFDVEPVFADITLTALWNEHNGNYTITFKTDKDTVYSTQNVRKWGRAVEPKTPTREGNYFAYWAKSDGSLFDFERETVSSDITLTAVWDTAEYFTVKFYTDGGSYVDSQRVRKGDKVKLPASPVKDGYDFVGWVDELSHEYNFNLDVEYDMGLTAKWMLKTYQVAFDSNGGSAVYTETINAGGKAFRPVDPVYNDGHKALDYWTLDGVKYNFNTPVNGNITLKAVWKEYKVGDRGPSGGYIFYDCDADNDSGNQDGLKSSECGWRFLEAAPNDLDSPSRWGDNSYDDYGTQNGIGKGKENTRILSGRNEDDIAHEVWGKNISGYSDWYVPSKEELKLMYENLYKNGLGNFRNDIYWSSSEKRSNGHSAYYACFLNFGNGKLDEHLRSCIDYVRPVRQF